MGSASSVSGAAVASAARPAAGTAASAPPFTATLVFKGVVADVSFFQMTNALCAHLSDYLLMAWPPFFS